MKTKRFIFLAILTALIFVLGLSVVSVSAQDGRVFTSSSYLEHFHEEGQGGHEYAMQQVDLIIQRIGRHITKRVELTEVYQAGTWSYAIDIYTYACDGDCGYIFDSISCTTTAADPISWADSGDVEWNDYSAGIDPVPHGLDFWVRHEYHHVWWEIGGSLTRVDRYCRERPDYPSYALVGFHYFTPGTTFNWLNSLPRYDGVADDSGNGFLATLGPAAGQVTPNIWGNRLITVVGIQPGNGALCFTFPIEVGNVYHVYNLGSTARVDQIAEASFWASENRIPVASFEVPFTSCP